MLAIDHQIEERNRRSFEHLRKLLVREIDGFEMEAPHVIQPGSAQGILIGGCLSIIVAMLRGSMSIHLPFFKEDQAILFLIIRSGP